jgi:hypothetical protein
MFCCKSVAICEPVNGSPAGLRNVFARALMIFVVLLAGVEEPLGAGEAIAKKQKQMSVVLRKALGT